MTDRTADALVDTIAPLLPDGGRRGLEAWEAESVQDVLDAAYEWHHGRLDLNHAAHIGAMEYTERHVDEHGHITTTVLASPRYTRFIAITTTPRSDPRWAALDALVCKIVAAHHIVTPQGVTTREEEHQHDQARQWLAQHDRRAA